MLAFSLFIICVNVLESKANLTFVDPKNVKNKDLLLTLSDGKIYGMNATTVGKGIPYYSFRGIPYAKPPLGNLRFEPPQKNDKWRGILNCTYDRSECLQQSIPMTGSENCLYINVYTTNLRANLPVMVWIYGGAFLRGNSSYLEYGCDYLLEDGIVFVSMNYRLGILGFLSTGDLAAPGNAGLKDQVLALQWVKSNIALFGGNPDKVTIFGQSAGSACVSYLLQSPKTTDLFHGAIMESGTSLNLWTLSRRGQQAAFHTGQALSIFTVNSTVLVQQLKLVDVSALQAVSIIVQLFTMAGNSLNGFIFSPVIEPEHDGAVFSGKSYQLLSSGNFQRVPCLMGFTSNEAAADAVLLEYFGWFVSINYDLSCIKLTPADLTNNVISKVIAGLKIKNHYVGLYVPFAMGPQESIFAVMKTLGKIIIPVQDLMIKIKTEMFVLNFCQFVNDDQFIRSVREAVLQISKYSTVYMYEFSFFGYLGFQGTRKVSGVGHAEELGYLFTTYVNESLVTAADLLTRARVVRLWTNFAKFGNPTPIKDELLGNFTWIPAGTNRTNLKFNNLNTSLQMRKNPVKDNMLFYDNIYEQYGDGDYDTY